MKEQIEQLHKSDIFGIFIEIGCGVPVAAAMLGVSGASNTIFMSESPYSRDYYKYAYNLDPESEMYRSVSPQYLKYILASGRFDRIYSEKPINTIYAASFQLGEMNDKSTHGWICLKHNQSVKY